MYTHTDHKGTPMEFKPEHEALITELADERNDILRKHQVRMTPTNKILMPVEHMESFGDAIDHNTAQLAALARIIARDTK